MVMEPRQIVDAIFCGDRNIQPELEDDFGKIRRSLLCFHELALMLFKTPGHGLVMSLEAGTFAKPIYERTNSLLDLNQ
jgi:hypothetical protein